MQKLGAVASKSMFSVIQQKKKKKRKENQAKRKKKKRETQHQSRQAVCLCDLAVDFDTFKVFVGNAIILMLVPVLNQNQNDIVPAYINYC